MLAWGGKMGETWRKTAPLISYPVADGGKVDGSGNERVAHLQLALVLLGVCGNGVLGTAYS